MSTSATWNDLPDLLHDARLLELRWVKGWLRSEYVAVSFDCLRRNADGSELTDRTVELRLSPVTVLALAYDSTDRPSRFQPQQVLTASDLRAWRYGGEAGVWANRPDTEELALDALRVDWLAGSVADLPQCTYRFGLSFGHGFPGFQILIGCDRIEALARGRPLSPDDWAAQYAAWWAGWRRHWNEKDQNPDTDAPSAAEDLTIPAGVDPPLPPDYPWPNEPIVEWEPTDAPADVLNALARWFEDDIDQQPGSFGGDVRFYARQIDEWWVEGKRAGVTVRGVEHSPPAGEEYPARNAECVQQCLLRRRPTRWIVQPLSRGWPPYKSAPARPANEKPWLARWRSGSVLSEPPQKTNG